ncbi:MAG TPA: hypothetical protein VLM17_04860, partial [Xanthomonadaceae bacterium]|nr:hypothetical protein [Xanthomonadaceae bacterium]
MNASARAVAAVFVAATLCVPAACTRDGGAPVQAQAGRAAADAQACLPRVRGGWIRLVPGGGMPMDAGYATIDNPCDAP